MKSKDKTNKKLISKDTVEIQTSQKSQEELETEQQDEENLKVIERWRQNTLQWLEPIRKAMDTAQDIDEFNFQKLTTLLFMSFGGDKSKVNDDGLLNLEDDDLVKGCFGGILEIIGCSGLVNYGRFGANRFAIPPKSKDLIKEVMQELYQFAFPLFEYGVKNTGVDSIRDKIGTVPTLNLISLQARSRRGYLCDDIFDNHSS